jgi:hypothetical protein
MKYTKKTIRYDDDDDNNNNNNNSIQFNSLFFYAPSQQPQSQLQTQHSVDTSNYIMDKHNNNSIQFNSILYYVCAESTTKRPITDTAQFRYR